MFVHLVTYAGKNAGASRDMRHVCYYDFTTKKMLVRQTLQHITAQHIRCLSCIRRNLQYQSRTLDSGTTTAGRCERQVRETLRDVQFLHNDQFFAAAQKKYVYIYDKRGIEVHCLKVPSSPTDMLSCLRCCVRVVPSHASFLVTPVLAASRNACSSARPASAYVFMGECVPTQEHIAARRLDFLPYHFLLTSVGEAGVLRYQVRPLCAAALSAVNVGQDGRSCQVAFLRHRSLHAGPSTALVFDLLTWSKSASLLYFDHFVGSPCVCVS